MTIEEPIRVLEQKLKELERELFFGATQDRLASLGGRIAMLEQERGLSRPKHEATGVSPQGVLKEASETRKLSQHSIWDDYPLELGQDYEIPFWSIYSGYKCPHSRGNVIPWVLIALNEGEHNSTGVCLECAVDIARELGLVPIDPKEANNG